MTMATLPPPTQSTQQVQNQQVDMNQVLQLLMQLLQRMQMQQAMSTNPGTEFMFMFMPLFGPDLGLDLRVLLEEVKTLARWRMMLELMKERVNLYKDLLNAIFGGEKR